MVHTQTGGTMTTTTAPARHASLLYGGRSVARGALGTVVFDDAIDYAMTEGAKLGPANRYMLAGEVRRLIARAILTAGFVLPPARWAKVVRDLEHRVCRELAHANALDGGDA